MIMAGANIASGHRFFHICLLYLPFMAITVSIPDLNDILKNCSIQLIVYV